MDEELARHRVVLGRLVRDRLDAVLLTERVYEWEVVGVARLRAGAVLPERDRADEPVSGRLTAGQAS